MKGVAITGSTRDILRRWAVNAYHAGHTIDEIAHIYGPSPATTWRLLAEAGVTMRRRGPRAAA